MKKLAIFALCIFVTSEVFVQNSIVSGGGELPVKRIALFSSGVGYFEHSGTVSGDAELTLTFEVDMVNDALKSLVVNDSGAGSPSVSYPSEDTLWRTLQSLGIDLSDNPGTAEIFASQRGAEVEVSAPNPITGRILGVEKRAAAGSALDAAKEESFLSLYTEGSVRVIALKDIASFAFKDSALNADLKRALDLIAANRTTRNRSLQVHLPGNGSREASLSYVVAVPVWKVSYRLDLGQTNPLFQGWAIVDNNSDTDWNNVELSLVSGRPVSFIQNLYPPYYFNRPTLPLAIAGSAQAETYAGGYNRQQELMESEEMAYAEEAMAYDMEIAAEPSAKMSRSMAAAPMPQQPRVNAVEAAATGSAAGDQFAFTVKNPVTLNRRQSAMIPLVNGVMDAEKSLVLSGAKAFSTSIHPDLAVELSNTTGMKLPAGPITVFDGGTYAGDALIEFFGESGKRLIKYGEDLSVIGTAALDSGSVLFSSVTISGGVMMLNYRQLYERTYTVKNTAKESKHLIIEHPITGSSMLVEPETYLEKTDSLYRFQANLPADGELVFKVKEEVPVSNRIVLGNLRVDHFAAYSTSAEYPANVRTALARAAELKRKNDAAIAAQTELQTRRTQLNAEQDRIRENLNAVGTGSDLGKEYMKRMTEIDKNIDALNKEAEAAAALVRGTQKDFADYIAELKL